MPIVEHGTASWVDQVTVTNTRCDIILEAILSMAVGLVACQTQLPPFSSTGVQVEARGPRNGCFALSKARRLQELWDRNGCVLSFESKTASRAVGPPQSGPEAMEGRSRPNRFFPVARLAKLDRIRPWDKSAAIQR